jgi:hypothetical protein|tara:strand:- start:380 stop:577 length:198 start_codon:yes stop_codon:yes gene_type:complete
MPESLGLGDLVVLHPPEHRFFHKHGIGMVVKLPASTEFAGACSVRWLKSGIEMIFQEKVLSRFTD